MTQLVLKDELLDAQVLRVAGAATYGGADLGECLAAARSLDGADLGRWFEVWRSLADRVSALGERDAAAGRQVSAQSAFWRASSYYRTAGVMLLGVPLDERLVESTARQTETFLQGAALMPSPPEPLEIPYEHTTLPGYFFRARAGDGSPRATVVLTGGYDSSAEELYFWNGAAALARGYNVVAFDGPGQGRALIERGLTLRPDWENVVGPVLDNVLPRSDVDADRVALIGLSLGAHLAPRAASGEHRLAACIADCGAFDLYAAALQRLPPPLARRLERGDRTAVGLTRRLLRRVMRQPTAGWALRRGLLVHGLDDPLELVEALREYSLAGRAERIRCPTWVCNAEEDAIGGSAPQLVDALTCPKEFVRFTAAEGAGDHCEAGARALYHARSFGWLDAILKP